MLSMLGKKFNRQHFEIFLLLQGVLKKSVFQNSNVGAGVRQVGAHQARGQSSGGRVSSKVYLLVVEIPIHNAIRHFSQKIGLK